MGPLSQEPPQLPNLQPSAAWLAASVEVALVVWNAFKRLARGASKEQKSMLFHDTAARVYRS
jgi:hypothetical protein